MTSAAVKTAVRGRLAARWDTGAAAIRQANTLFDPAGRPWIEVRFPGAAIERGDIGDPDHPLWIETGAFMCDAYVPAGCGEEVADQLADLLANLFMGRAFDGVECHERLAGIAGERTPTGVEGVWWGVSFGIGYRHQFIGSPG